MTVSVPLHDPATDELAARAKVLIVDDRADNLDLLELILEPLDVDLVKADSGEEALRVLLEHDVAVIVLDVRMPTMDGYETAQFVKQRERTKHVPIIFLTAVGSDGEHARSGYEAGAVDFMQKPVDPVALRAKVATFAELHRSRLQIALQAEQLRAAAAREAARELAEVRARGAQRYRDLAEAVPTMVFSIDEDGALTFRSRRWEEFAGERPVQESDDQHFWSLVHPSDVPTAQRIWADVVHGGADGAHPRLELSVRLRRRDGAYLWHDIDCVPTSGEGSLSGWVGTATEVDTARRIERSQRVLADAGAELVSSAELNEALKRVAELTVPDIVDWCSIDLVEDSGEVRRIATRAAGELHPDHAERFAELAATERAGSRAASMLEEAAPQQLLLDAEGADVAADPERASVLLVSLAVRGRKIGVVALGVGTLGRSISEPEREFARALATRLASAADAARLSRRVQERAQAAEVLDAIADGVALIDRAGVVRLWNPAAAAITGVASAAIVGRAVADVLPDWDAMAARVPVSEGGANTVTTSPLTTADGREAWLSVSAVGFALGVAFAFRDLTEERAVERMKSDFVATVSHELRTPLASIYGAAATLQRDDLELEEQVRGELLDIVAQQAQQLANIVDEVLTASRLDAGEGQIATKPVDAPTLAREVVDAARSRAGDQHEVRLEAAVDESGCMVSADPSHLRQVLDNLVENAIKYSPDGGEVILRVLPNSGTIAFEVLDQGVGIPVSDQRRVFEKFYRVDADMSRGVGGTGLGLFIVRELVRRMAGRIDLASTPGRGSSFTVTLPRALPAHE